MFGLAKIRSKSMSKNSQSDNGANEFRANLLYNCKRFRMLLMSHKGTRWLNCRKRGQLENFMKSGSQKIWR